MVDSVQGFAPKAWGVEKGKLAVMVHTGSVSLGKIIGGQFDALARDMYPKSMTYPESGVFALPFPGHGSRYLDAMNNGLNFALCNRMFLGVMAIRALTEALGRKVSCSLVYDAPHNFIEQKGDTFIHRKGACPADGPSDVPGYYAGYPVIVPGSMGSPSHLMSGCGNVNSLCSASHGAGRSTSRQKSRKKSGQDLRVVTKIARSNLPKRMVAEYDRKLQEEGPSSYKDIGPVVDTLVSSQIASPVCTLTPLLTVKGI